MSAGTFDSNQWWQHTIEDLKCPRCGKADNDDEYGGLFLVLPCTLAHELDPRVPNKKNSHVILCYECAVECLMKVGADMLVSNLATMIPKLVGPSRKGGKAED